MWEPKELQKELNVTPTCTGYGRRRDTPWVRCGGQLYAGRVTLGPISMLSGETSSLAWIQLRRALPELFFSIDTPAEDTPLRNNVGAT